MLTLLACLPLLIFPEGEAVPATPFDRVLELEITAADLPLGARGPAVVVEYEVLFSGTLHIWTRSDMDLFLRVEDGNGAGLLVEDDNSGGGDVPYAKLAVEVGDYLGLLLASSAPGELGPLELCIVAASESADTRAAAAAAEEGRAEIRRRRAQGDLDGARALAHALVNELLATRGSVYSEVILEQLKVLGILAREIGSLAPTGAAWTAVHRNREHMLPVDHRGLLEAKQDLALILRELGDLEGARPLNKYVHAARERLLPAMHPALIAAKQNLALTRRDHGDLAGALELEQYVHSVREQALPADHPALLAAKQNLAVTLKELGEIERALPFQERVHAARERTLPADHPDLLFAKQNLALTLKELGDLESALILEEHVHAARERTLPADHPDLLRAKSNLALTRRQFGDLEAARALFQHVLLAREKFLPIDHPDLLDARQNLALTHLELGDLVGAEALFESVHAARVRLLPPEHLRLLAAKQNLAAVRNALGDLESALALEEHVHAMRVRLLPPDNWAVLVAKQNLAVTRKNLGDLSGALALEEHVHASRERLLPDDHPALLTAKQNLATTRRRLGDLEGALALEEQVYAGRQRLLPADHRALLVAMQSLALTRRAVGDLEGAQVLVRRLLSAQLLRSISLRRESLRIARAGAREELQRLSLMLFLSEFTPAQDRGAVVAELFTVLENLRAVSTSSSRAALLAARVPELAMLRDRVARARRELNDHALSAPSDELTRIEAWRTRLFQLGDERDRLGREMRAELAKHGDFQAFTVERVAAGMKDGAALISFLRYARIDLDPETGAELPPEDSLLAFVVTRDATVQRVELGSADEVEQLAIAWRASLGKPLGSVHAAGARALNQARGIGRTDVPSSVGTEWEAGHALRERLMDPCIAALGEHTPATVHLILDDFLHLLPMQALPWDESVRLGEVASVRVETSMRRLNSPTDHSPGSGTLVAIGGVDFDAADATPSSSLLPAIATPPTHRGPDRASSLIGFLALPQTRLEVRALASLYEQHVSDGALVLEGTSASKAKLHELAPRARYLHIATHGWFAPEAFKSMIDEAQGASQRDLLARADDSVRGFAPETLCGLAFAGANHGVNSSGKVPGIMTAEELTTLDLSSCELAVLSACETNVGIRRSGQGIQSLQAALHSAGARTAITSLWKVDDAATRKLFEVFYAHLWIEEAGKADALWRAKMTLRDAGHPLEHWAGWVLTGDPE